MAYKNFVKAIPLTSLASSSFSSSYSLVTASTGLPKQCFMLKIINNSDQDVTVSYDGTNDHDFVPTKTNAELKTGDVNQPNTYTTIWAKGTTVWVKGTAGMSGSVYVVGYYQPSAD